MCDPHRTGPDAAPEPAGTADDREPHKTDRLATFVAAVAATDFCAMEEALEDLFEDE